MVKFASEKLFKNDTALHLCMETDRRWKGYVVSFGSLVAFQIRFPISCTVSMASSFHIPDMSIAIGANVCRSYGCVFHAFEFCGASKNRRFFEIEFSKRVRNSPKPAVCHETMELV